MTDSQKDEKTNVMGQDVIAPSLIDNDNVTLDVVDQFTYVGSSIEGHLSLCAAIHTRTAKAAAVVFKRNKSTEVTLPE